MDRPRCQSGYVHGRDDRGIQRPSVSLQADSVDFLGDTANYGMSPFVAGMALRNRAMAALCKGVTMGLFGIWVLASSVWKVFAGAPPERLCSRNDLIGNCAVVAAAIGVARTAAVWPDVLVAAIMAVLSLQGAAVIVMQVRAEPAGAPA